MRNYFIFFFLLTSLIDRIVSIWSQPRYWFVFAFRRRCHRLPHMRYANGTFPFLFTVFLCFTSALCAGRERKEAWKRGAGSFFFVVVATAAATAKLAFAHVHE